MNFSFSKFSLRAQFLGPLALALMLVVIVFVSGFLVEERERTDEVAHRTFLSAQRRYDGALEKEAQKLAAVMDVLREDPALRDALRARDRAALSRRAQPFFARLRDGYGITHLYFHGPDRVNLLRAHQPERFGDRIDRFTAVQAERTGRLAYGVELGPLGTFTLRAVTPWVDDGRLIGYLELGMEIGHVFADLQSNLGVAPFVAIDKRFLVRESWDQGMRMLGLPASWDTLPDAVITYHGSMALPAPALALLSPASRPAVGDAKVTEGGRIFHAATFPLQDAAGRVVGRMLFLRDTTATRESNVRRVVLVTFVSLAIGAALFLFFYVFAGRLERRLKRYSEELEGTVRERTAELEALGRRQEWLIEEARSARERLEFLLSSNPSVVYTRKPSGDYAATFISEGVVSQLGYTPSDFLEDPGFWGRHIHPEDAPKIFADLPHLFEAGHHTHEYRLLSKDGIYRWMHDGMKLIRDADGNPREIVGSWVDITDLKMAEESQAQLAMAVEQSADVIVVTDREGTIQYVNPAFERITGYSREETIGKNPRVLRSGKHDEAFYRELWDTLTRGEVWTGRFINRKKDGSLIEEDATISPLRDSSGEIVNYVATKRDVTELVSLERQVRMAQKMESVGTLAGGIAHDFNNALTGIVGFGELLRNRMAGDEQALHDLGEILRCADRATTLTRQLLTFARRQIIEPVNLNLSTVIADLMKLIGKVVGEHIEVKTSLEKNVPTIYADRGQIEQVVMNLCLNARDAMPEGGRLVVETGDVYLEEEGVRQYPYMRTGRYALLTVSDTGVGMDEKTRERVFDPFFTTKGPDKGTGLGLAMVYGIVKQHGGFIHLYSEPGKGTAFKVYFPAIEAQPDAVPEKRKEEMVHGGMETILLAEDEEAIRSFIERTLKELGYNVLVARNGEEAIGIFSQNKEIVLAVLDVVMPRKGGKEAFEEMHKQNPRLKVIFMSGYTSNGIHDSFMLLAGMPFLQKPFGPTMLARKIREVLDTQ